MKMFKKIIMMAAVLGGFAILSMQVSAQERPARGERGGERGGRPERGEQRGEQRERGVPRDREQAMEQMRQRQTERMQQALGMADEEWTLIGPMIEKVRNLNQQAHGRGMGGAMAGRGQARAEASGVDEAARELRTLLAGETATADEIAGKLQELRDARQESLAELEQAQVELRELLTQRQEAQLVLMGLLD